MSDMPVKEEAPAVRREADAAESRADRLTGDTVAGCPPADTDGFAHHVILSAAATEAGHLPPEIPDATDPLTGTTLGSVVIEERIAAGGMGFVYRGRQQTPSRPVAVKLLRNATDRARIDRFLREAELLGQLNHPGLPAVYELGNILYDGVSIPAIVMEFIPAAEPLVGSCVRRQLSAVDRLQLFLEACDTLAAVHAHGVVHGDLSPANLLVSNQPVSPDVPPMSRRAATSALAAPPARVKVVDFGMAVRVADGSTAEPVEGLQGTWPYVSPEQCRGERQAIDARSDVYVLGLVLFELLTGHLPDGLGPRSSSLPRTAAAGPITPASAARRLVITDHSLGRATHRNLRRLIARCLAKEPAARFRDAGDLAVELRRVVAAEGEPAAAGRQQPRRAIAAGLTGLVGIVAAAGMFTGNSRWMSSRFPDDPVLRAVMPPGLHRDAAPQPPSVKVSPNHWTTWFSLPPADPDSLGHRKTPLNWVRLRLGPTQLNPLLRASLTPASFRLTRDGKDVPTPGLTFEYNESDPFNCTVHGFEQPTERKGHYTLELIEPIVGLFGGTAAAPQSLPLYAWTMPPSHRFRFSLHDDSWDDHVVSMQGLTVQTDDEGPKPARFICPTVVGEEGSVTMRFRVDYPIETARLWATIAIWTTMLRPFGEGPGQLIREADRTRPIDPGASIYLDVSRDGQNWRNVDGLFWGHAGIASNPINIDQIVSGSHEVWVRARLLGTQPYRDKGLSLVQFLRSPADSTDPTFLLDLNGPFEP